MKNELNLMKYKYYFTRVYADMEEHTLFGRLEGIIDLVTWETEGTLVDAETEFHAAVDDYLEFCLQNGKIPQITNLSKIFSEN